MSTETKKRMWRIEGEDCKTLSSMMDDHVERLKFLNKTVQDAQKKRNDFIESAHKEVWDKVYAVLGFPCDADLHLTMDPSTCEAGVLIVRESDKNTRGNDFLGILLGLLQ